jgi:hypothetical protein
MSEAIKVEIFLGPVAVWDLGRDEQYHEGLGLLRDYLREAGRSELADRVAYAVNSVTPSVVVNGRLIYLNDCPGVDEFLRVVKGSARGGS